MKKTISIVVPAYNEAGNIVLLFQKICSVFEGLPQYNFEVIYVNDGSNDSTCTVLHKLASSYKNIKFIDFSKNFGHQMAVKAGIDHAFGDAVISIDGDLQHPPELIKVLIEEWEKGYDVVYTLRTYCSEEPATKRWTSKLYYKVLRVVADVEIEEGSADFRLIDKKVADIFRKIEDTDPFLRGLIKWMGFSRKAIRYQADQRFSGSSTYNFKKMMQLAVSGITSFSTKPLHIAVYLGFFFAMASILYIPYVIWAFVSGTEISGWASLIMTVVFFGGLHLVILGVLGIYIGKIFKQTKHRPNYIIKEKNF